MYLKKSWSLVNMVVIVLMLCSACGGRGSENVTSQDVGERHFRLPDVPETLTDPVDRANFVVQHYWDDFNFKMSEEKSDSDFVEQVFVDYVVILALADSVNADQSVSDLVKAAAHYGFGEGLMELARHYLNHPNSPMRHEVSYLMFLKHYASLEGLPFEKKERALYLIKQLQKNRMGSRATDFAMVDRKGSKYRLSEIQSPYVILIFNDSDCESCRAMMPQIVSLPELQSDNVTVVAIYPDSLTEVWRNPAATYPQNWMDVYSPNGEIMARQLYYLPAMPSLYLLDKDKKVLLKDADLVTLKNALDEI